MPSVSLVCGCPTAPPHCVLSCREPGAQDGFNAKTFLMQVASSDVLLVGVARLFPPPWGLSLRAGLVSQMKIASLSACATSHGSGELHNAAERGDFDTLQRLLVAGASVNAINKFDRSALHLACQYGNAECARLLIEAGADVRIRNEHQRTPIHYACLYGHAHCAELLLGAGAELDSLHDNASGKETSPHRLRLPLTPMQLPTPRRSAPVVPYYPS